MGFHHAIDCIENFWQQEKFPKKVAYNLSISAIRASTSWS